jgi:hypothetical protein
VQPFPLEQLSQIWNSHRKNVVVGREYWREIAHMQVDQCGNQEDHAEVLRRRRRAVRAIAAKANLPQCRLSRYYLLFSAIHLPSRAAAGLRRVFLPQAQAA